MKAPHSERFSANVITLAVQGALVAMFAAPLGVHAGEANEEVTALTQPTNFIEIGAGYTSKDSAKFGEYNGLDNKGADLIGNFSVRGGDAYKAQEGGDGINRWEVKGTDLGTTSRELSGTVGDQGKWSLGIGYDELRHNITDTYQTPFQGSMGGNSFALPLTFGVIKTSTAAVPYGSDALTDTQKAAFQTKDVHTDRKNTSFDAKYIFDSHWDVKFDYNHLDQSGAKLLGVAGEKATGIGGINTWAGQTPLVLMNPTNYTTDNFNLALGWKGDQGHASASYFGSRFRDGYNSLSFMNPFQTTSNNGVNPTAFPVQTMSTMPGNDFHQLNLLGGYAFTSTTKLAGGLSYGRNTQNDAYSASGVMGAGGLPQSSLNGVVVSTHADLKLTNQTTKDLLLSAGLKYNQRDNQTASSIYNWQHINEAAAGQTAVNAPMSNKKTQIEIAGDYRIDKDQKLRLSYEHEQIKRWCNNAAANNGPSNFSNLPYWGGTAYSPTTCAEVPDSKENKLAANYKLKASEDVSFNAGYGYARRKADINPAFYNPMQVESGGEGFNVLGFMAYFQASRKEQLLKAGVNWQANEKLSLGLNGRYTDDKYDSTYGVQNGNSWSLNLDATYSYGENSSVSAYVTTQNSSRDLTNLFGVGTSVSAATATKYNVPVGGTWTNKLKENDTTIGLGTKKGGLMGGKLELAGDLTYSLGKSGYGTQLNFANADSSLRTCSSAVYDTCGDLPDIKSELVQLKLTGSYKVDKASKVMMGYMYQHLKSSDYFYNAYQTGSSPTATLPTNQQAPNYTVNSVYVAYSYSFK